LAAVVAESFFNFVGQASQLSSPHVGYDLCGLWSITVVSTVLALVSCVHGAFVASLIISLDVAGACRMHFISHVSCRTGAAHSVLVGCTCGCSRHGSRCKLL